MSFLDLSGAEVDGGPVPAGVYSVVLEKAEIAPTKSGGEMIKTVFNITGPSQAGRKVFTSYNIKNDNPKAVQIGMSQLKTMLTAFGFKNPNRLESVTELMGLKGQIKTTVDESNPAYPPQAVVKGYKALAKTDGLGSSVAPGNSEAAPF